MGCQMVFLSQQQLAFPLLKNTGQNSSYKCHLASGESFSIAGHAHVIRCQWLPINLPKPALLAMIVAW
jgi:hypothetical protein